MERKDDYRWREDSEKIQSVTNDMLLIQVVTDSDVTLRILFKFKLEYYSSMYSSRTSENALRTHIRDPLKFSQFLSGPFWPFSIPETHLDSGYRMETRSTMLVKALVNNLGTCAGV